MDENINYILRGAMCQCDKHTLILSQVPLNISVVAILTITIVYTTPKMASQRRLSFDDHLFETHMQLTTPGCYLNRTLISVPLATHLGNEVFLLIDLLRFTLSNKI